MDAQAVPPTRLTVVNQEEGDQELPNEVYVISALLQSGQYCPETHGLTDEHFMAYRQVHKFLNLYQRQAKAAPPLALLLDKFPRFPYVPGVSAAWAAKQLQAAFVERGLRLALAKSGMLISEGRIEEAAEAMRVSSGIVTTTSSIDTRDGYARVIRNQDAPERTVPVMEGTLSRFCRGIAPGQMWFVGGIPGMGKSYRLMEHAVVAVEAGWDVDFYNLEMNPDEVIKRFQQMLMVGSEFEYGTEEFADELDALSADYGRLRFHTGMVSPVDVEARAKDNTLIIVDYVSKLRSRDGARSIVDYRIAGGISADLKDIAINCKVPVLSAVQFNKDAYDKRGTSMKNTSDTDSYNKDPDVFIGMNRLSETVVLNTILKNRHDIAGRKFYTRFAPGSSRAVELSFDEAHEAIYEDTERGLSQ